LDHDNPSIANDARRDFQKARQKAFWQEFWALLTGKSIDLLRFEEVKQHLNLRGERSLGLQNIPVNKIIGSVGRYQDFTRNFLPRKSVNQHRWQQVNALARGMMGFPPIEVYKVGDAYFVIDGNHRVSVARQLKMPTIEAYVTEFQTLIPIDENTTIDDILLKEGYAEFLQRTQLNLIRPDADLHLTVPGQYRHILEHIDVHRYFMGLERKKPIPYTEAVASWYDNVYTPMIESIREHAILEEFPKRTEADVYVWLISHQAALRDNYGGEWLTPEETVKHFLEHINPKSLEIEIEADKTDLEA
jgi:hypothetical protein